MATASKPTQQELVVFYTHVLESLGLEVNSEGMIALVVEEDRWPVMIGDKRLVLPTADILRTAPWDTSVGFHPIGENVFRGKSQVINKLKDLIVFRLSVVVGMLMTELVEIAGNEAYHEKLTPEQAELLTHLPRVSKKTVETFTKVVEASSPTGHNKLVNIYLKHGGKYQGEDYKRVAVTTFPIREYFDPDAKEIFGVKFGSKKDMSAFEALFNYLLPECSIAEAYNHGSRSETAPYLEALLSAYVKVAKHLDAVTWLFRKHLSDYKSLRMNVTNWDDELNDLGKYRDLIPVLAGNEGVTGVKDKRNATTEDAERDHVDTRAGNSRSSTPAKKTMFSRLAEDVQNKPSKPVEDESPLPVHNPSRGVIDPQHGAPAASSTSGKKRSWASIQNAQNNQQPGTAGSAWQQQANGWNQQQQQPPMGFAGKPYDPMQARFQQNNQPTRFGGQQNWNNQSNRFGGNRGGVFSGGI